VQGGDPTGTGKGGIEQTIAPEIKRAIFRGAVVAARRGDERNPKKESHGSQFLIMKQAYMRWNRDYTAFGQVVRGLEFVDAIPEGQKEKDYLVPAESAVKIVKIELIPEASIPPLPPRPMPPSVAPGRPPSATPYSGSPEATPGGALRPGTTFPPPVRKVPEPPVRNTQPPATTPPATTPPATTPPATTAAGRQVTASGRPAGAGVGT